MGGTTKHLAVIGGTGSGKTTLAKFICSIAPCPVVVIDWDGEYRDIGLPILEPPFLLPDIDLATLLSNIERPPDGGHGISFAAVMASKSASTIDDVIRELERLAFSHGLLANWAQAALIRAQIVRKYCIFIDEQGCPQGCIFDLSQIPERERAIVQQTVATTLILSRQPNSPLDPLLLVIEEGAMGATEYYLKDLVTLSRRRNVKLLWIAQSLPPEELLNSFTLLIGDPGPLWDRWSRLLAIPLPRRMGWGEFIVYDGKGIKKVKVK